jgi:MFS transporter, FHS family, glucose/mannose:H+ symporter
MPSRIAAIRLESLPSAPFYAGFVIAGMATVLLGPILPVLRARWSLTDFQAGSLFATQFTGSTLGAILASHFRRGSLLFGYASVAAGLATLALGNYEVIMLAFALVGVGLGSATTATNLTFGTERPEQRGAMLTRVNLFWGIGAVSCPPFVSAAVDPGTLRLVLLGLSFSALAVFGALTLFLRRRKAAEPDRKSIPNSAGRLSPPVFILFSLLLFLYVGAETCISGWIATYIHRFDFLSPERSSLYVSAFWISIVLGRAVTPTLSRRVSEFAILMAGLLAALVGVSILLFPHGASVSLAAVALAGLGCAPIFPLTVARLLARIGYSRHVGWIFAICGSGGAVLPWVTGLYSAHLGSLRGAFVVPLAAMAGVLLLALTDRVLPIGHTEPRVVLP